MSQSILKIGNSYGATFPRDFVVRNKLKVGARVETIQNNGSITFITKIPKTLKHEVVSDKEFLELVKEVETRYGPALKDLADLS